MSIHRIRLDGDEIGIIKDALRVYVELIEKSEKINPKRSRIIALTSRFVDLASMQSISKYRTRPYLPRPRKRKYF